MAFIMLGHVSSWPIFEELLSYMGAEFCQKLFLHLLRLLYGFIFQLANTVYHIDCFVYIEQSLCHWHKIDHGV